MEDLRLPVLENEPVLAAEVEALMADWEEQPAVAATNAIDQIEQLKEARGNALSYSMRCWPLIDKVPAALGEEHSASRELLEAEQLLSDGPATGV